MLLASNTIVALQLVAAVGAVLAAVGIPLTAFARRPRLRVGEQGQARLGGGAYLGLPDQELRVYLTVSNSGWRRGARGARVIVDSLWPTAHPEESRDIAYPELRWAEQPAPGEGVVIFPAGAKAIEVGQLLALVRNASGRITANDGRTDWQTMLSRGGQWEFQLSLSPTPAPDDARAHLAPRPAGYTLRIIVGADDAAARRYDIAIAWNEDATDIIEAQESMRIRARRVRS